MAPFGFAKWLKGVIARLSELDYDIGIFILLGWRIKNCLGISTQNKILTANLTLDAVRREVEPQHLAFGEFGGVDDL